MAQRKEKVIVLGAGLQGACVALEAARRGHAVCLVDRAPTCLDRTSLRNEGKIHLGHVYANDPEGRTADLMLRSALCFAPLLDMWVPGGFDWPAMRSTPFQYVIARDTLVPADSLLAHYDDVESRCLSMQAEDPSTHYLGERLERLSDRRPVPDHLSADFVEAVVETPEVSIDLVALRHGIAVALENDPGIELLYGHTVRDVVRTSHGFTVAGYAGAGEAWSRAAGRVVNALWDGRLAVDTRMGLAPERPWVYRLKHRVLGRRPPALAALPSMTMVLGPFGDVVTRPRDDLVYLSWYPACQTGWSRDIEPPAEWQGAASGALIAGDQQAIVANTLAAFDEIVPGLGAVRDTYVDGGVIFAWGASDIDESTSELHQRHRIGITESDGYFSIDTGKLTSAPMFARDVGAMLQ